MGWEVRFCGKEGRSAEGSCLPPPTASWSTCPQAAGCTNIWRMGAPESTLHPGSEPLPLRETLCEGFQEGPEVSALLGTG